VLIVRIDTPRTEMVHSLPGAKAVGRPISPRAVPHAIFITKTKQVRLALEFLFFFQCFELMISTAILSAGSKSNS
jgi:hypothetical protein